MALSIKTPEADELARSLARLTGETMTEAVTVALRERLDRERARRAKNEGLADRIEKLASKLRKSFDTRPVTKEEYDALLGEEG